jgi:ABC-type polysaccharide/polyol phosphate export permease
MSRLREFAGTQELALNLTLRELRGRYKRSVLGWSWSLINPLATVLIYSLVFSYFLKIEPPRGHPSGLHSFALFLLCALIPWNLFQNGLNMGLGSLIGNGNLIKKVYFPRELLVASGTASLVVTMLIEMGVLSAILLLFGNMVIPWLPMVLLLIALEAAFVFGIALMLSVFNVYFRDVQHFVSILLMMLFYTVPIVYPIRYVPIHAHVFGMEIPLRRLYSLNPLVRIVGAFRDVLYDLRFPPLWDLAYVFLWAIGTVVFGMWVFGKLDRRLAEEV